MYIGHIHLHMCGWMRDWGRYISLALLSTGRECNLNKFAFTMPLIKERKELNEGRERKMEGQRRQWRWERAKEGQ